MRTTTFVALLALGTVSVQAADLSDVLRQAQQSDPTLKAAEAQMHAGQEARAQAYANFLPQVTASYNLNRGTTEANFLGQKLDYPDTDIKFWNISLNETLYSHDNYLGYSQAKKQAAQAEAQYQQAYQDFLVRVAQAYFTVLNATEDLRFRKAEEKAIERQMEQAQQRFEVGLAAITDVHEARASYDGARAATILAANALDDAWEALTEITGKSYQRLEPLLDELPLDKPQPDNMAAWEQLAVDRSPDLALVRLQEEVAELGLDRARAQRLPVLRLTASYGENTNNNYSFFDADRGLVGPFAFTTTSSSWGLNVSVTLFTGLRISSSVRQAAANYESAQQQQDAARRQVLRNVRNAWRGYLAGAEEVKARKQALISARSALEATQAGFEVGTRTIVDVLLSQRNLYAAEGNYSRARHSLILAMVSLKRAAGVLAEKDLLALNGLLKK